MDYINDGWHLDKDNTISTNSIIGDLENCLSVYVLKPGIEIGAVTAFSQ